MSITTDETGVLEPCRKRKEKGMRTDSGAEMRDIMFWKRLLSGIVLIAASLVLFFLGGAWLLTALAALSILGLYEMLRIFQLEKHPFAFVVYLGTLLYDAVLFDDFWITHESWSWCVLILVFVVLLTFFVFRYPKDTFDQVAKCAFAFVYVTVLMSYIYQTRCYNEGQWLVWLIMIGSWGSDTCAYVVGVLAGKHHFSELSPKKTVEGCVGGVLGAALIGYIYSLFVPDMYVLSVSPAVAFPVIAAICALVSQVGDLAASAIKRNYEVKDYGTVIPGHGGILDRYDSVLFVAPFVYYLLLLFSSVSVYVS